VLAAFAQFDNDVRSDRPRAGMRAALELGRWVFLAPLGYINAPRAMGKSLMPDPDRGPMARRAFEEYATGRFNKQQILEQATAWGLRNRHAERLREELTLARIAKRSTELDELDVEGILAFAERVLPRAADLWVQAPLEQPSGSNSCSFPRE
jgi:DNA invertase Pin-like site-specific DNA recombinase